MINEYLADSVEAVARLDIGEIENAIRILKNARINGNTVWTIGNGGSAATAEHFANDLVKMAGVRSISLSSLIPTITAFGNDNGWDRMYADLIQKLRQEKDVLVAISCSGRSPNVVEAGRLFSHEYLIVMTGNRYDSPLAGMDADAKIFVRDDDIRVQEDAHLVACHVIAGELRK